MFTFVWSVGGRGRPGKGDGERGVRENVTPEGMLPATSLREARGFRCTEETFPLPLELT